MKNLQLILKNKYDLAIGEKTFEEIKRKIGKICKTKIKISGRSYKTGNRETVNITLEDLLGL